MNDMKSLCISPAELMRMARQETAIEMDDPDALEPLTRFCDSAARSAELTEQGETRLLGKLKAFLKNRLRMARDIAAHPEILQQKVTIGPVIYGAPRSGTTKLQKLMAASGDFNAMPLWAGLYPALLSGDRSESPQARMDKGKDWVQWNCDTSPTFMAAHPFEAMSADEEMFAVEQSFCFYTLGAAYAETPAFAEWVFTQPPQKAMLFMKQVLQYLQWQGLASETKPWLLKCPAHLGFEPAFLSVFPEARFLLPHRHPQETSASTLGMSRAFRAPFSNKLPDGLFWLSKIPMFMLMHLEHRKNHPNLRVLDLDYLEVVARSEDAVRKIYAFLDMPLSDTALAAMRQWDMDNPKGTHGSHKYSFEDFGITWEMVAPAYQPYIQWLATAKLA